MVSGMPGSILSHVSGFSDVNILEKAHWFI